MERQGIEKQVRFAWHEKEPEQYITEDRDELRNDKGALFAKALGHLSHRGNDDESGYKCTHRTMQRGPIAGTCRIAVEQIVDNDQECVSRNDIEGVEYQESGSSDLTKLSDAESFERRNEDFFDAEDDAFGADGDEICSVERGLASNENRGDKRKQGAGNGHPDGQISHPLVRSFWKPFRIIQNHPKPRCNDPSPLPDELGNGHDLGALVKVFADFIAHCHVWHAEDGQDDCYFLF